LPLGTGNDLSRTLGWGPGYNGEKLSTILDQVSFETEPVLLDRWRVICIPDNEKDEPKELVMNNYFSIGVDAKVALAFHEKREEKPHLFSNRLANKGWYAGFGIKNLVSRPQSLQSEGVQVTLENHQELNLSAMHRLEALVVLNINSYAGGTDIWGTSPPEFMPPSFNDFLLEVVGLGGIAHMSRIQAGIDKGTRLAQTAYIRIRNPRPIAVQVDGEPWMQKPSTIVITHANQAVMLRRLCAKPRPQ